MEYESTYAIRQRNFLDSWITRLIALAVAIGIGWFMYTHWWDDMTALFSPDRPGVPVLAPETPAVEVHPALQACLDKRVGDVEAMKSDGIINEAQYGEFRTRAEELCHAQNPK